MQRVVATMEMMNKREEDVVMESRNQKTDGAGLNQRDWRSDPTGEDAPTLNTD